MAASRRATAASAGAECQRSPLLPMSLPLPSYGTSLQPLAPRDIDTMPPNDDADMPKKGWLGVWGRALAAEALGTALLVLLGCACVRPGAALGAVALGWGCVVTAVVAALGPVSGAHLNPAVTLGAVIMRALPPIPAAAYAVSQCVGAVLGYSALWLLDPALRPVTTHPVPPVSALQAAGVECALTATLLLVVCALWASPAPAPDATGPLRVGLAIAGLVVAGGPLSGASLNPARSLGPALIHCDWADHWVYWVGPLSGAASAASLYRWVLRVRPAPARDPLPATSLREVKHDDD